MKHSKLNSPAETENNLDPQSEEDYADELEDETFPISKSTSKPLTKRKKTTLSNPQKSEVQFIFWMKKEMLLPQKIRKIYLESMFHVNYAPCQNENESESTLNLKYRNCFFK